MAVDQNPGWLIGVVSFVQLCIDALEFAGKRPSSTQSAAHGDARPTGYFAEAAASGAECDELGVGFGGDSSPLLSP